MIENETLDEYLTRIGGKNNLEKNEQFNRFDKDE